MKKWKIWFCQRIDGRAKRWEDVVKARTVREALGEFERKGFINASVIGVWSMEDATI